MDIINFLRRDHRRRQRYTPGKRGRSDKLRREIAFNRPRSVNVVFPLFEARVAFGRKPRNSIPISRPRALFFHRLIETSIPVIYCFRYFDDVHPSLIRRFRGVIRLPLAEFLFFPAEWKVHRGERNSSLPYYLAEG